MPSLSDGEDARLEDEARRLENAEELRSLASGHRRRRSTAMRMRSFRELGSDRAASRRPSNASIRRSRVSRSTYDTAYYAIEALARELEEYEASIDLDPARLEDVRRRRDLLFRLTKKYGGSLADVIRTGAEARAELDLVDSAGLDITPTRNARTSRARRTDASARALTAELRQAGADSLARAVDDVLPDLGMADGHVTSR